MHNHELGCGSMRQKRVRFVKYVLLGFLLAGCIPASVNPISPPKPEGIDRGLLGTWYSKDEDGPGFIHIGIDKQSHIVSIVMIENKQNGSVKSEEYIGHGSKIGDATYLNLKIAYPEVSNPNYFFVKYGVEKDNVLKISIMDSTRVKTDISNNTIAGKIQDGQWAGDILITADSHDLAQYIKKYDSKLFHDFQYLQRLKLSNKSPRPAPAPPPKK